MKRFFILGAALGVMALAAAAPPAMAAVSVGFSIHGGDPFHGYSLNLSSAPDVVLIPGTSVGYVQNYDGDLYCDGDQWYLDQDGQWYGASSYNGPFVAIAVTSLPFDVGRFPAGYRRGVSYHPPAYTYQQRAYQDQQPAYTYQQRTYSYQQPTYNRVDRGYADRDRDRSYQFNTRVWNQRDGQTQQNVHGWNQHTDNRSASNQGWHGQNPRGNGGRFGGRDRGGNRG